LLHQRACTGLLCEQSDLRAWNCSPTIVFFLLAKDCFQDVLGGLTEDADELLTRFAGVVRACSEGDSALEECMSAFLTLLERVHPELGVGKAQDCSVNLLTLLLSRFKKDDERWTSLCTRMATHTTCVACGHAQVFPDPNLSNGIPELITVVDGESDSLQAGLERFEFSEIISDFSCSNCKKKTEATRCFEITGYGDAFFVQIQQFDARGVKVENHLEFPRFATTFVISFHRC